MAATAETGLGSVAEVVFSAGLLEAGVADLAGVVLPATVPLLGSGSSNSSADKHPNLSKNPDNPDLFFFFDAALAEGRAVEVVGLEDDAAGVSVVFSLLITIGGMPVVALAARVPAR